MLLIDYFRLTLAIRGNLAGLEHETWKIDVSPLISNKLFLAKMIVLWRTWLRVAAEGGASMRTARADAK